MELGTIKPVNLDTEMRSAYLDYAMSVIVSRALPDVRDGLKPVQRRILYAMHRMGLRHNTPYRKSAGIVGEVLKEYHPHGDQSVYDALARMAQDFSLRYPLVDGQGNLGSVDGDPPAAMRYTEATAIGHRRANCWLDIDKETVDFRPNYDDKTQEPTVLPARLPNLLLNGASGIAVGMATNIPPHNLGELADAIILPDRQSRCGRRRPDAVHARPRLSHRRHHPGRRGHPRSLCHRQGPRGHARQSLHRREQGRTLQHHRHRTALPGEQGHPAREDRRADQRRQAARGSAWCATSLTATVCAW